MPAGELYINDKDAFTTWGVSMEDGLSALLSPANMKPYVTNKSRLEHGTRVMAVNPKVDEREVTIVVHLLASSTAQFLERLHSFVAEMEQGAVSLRTSYEPSVTYHLHYMSMTQFTQFMMGMAKFSIRFTEYNPKSR